MNGDDAGGSGGAKGRRGIPLSGSVGCISEGCVGGGLGGDKGESRGRDI